MKVKKLLIIAMACIMVFAFAACGSSDDKTAAFEKHTIPYPDGYDTTSAGASSYDGCDDHFDGGYFQPLDVYNMKSGDSLTVIPKFETYQQTTEYTCGASSALMVMNHYGKYNPKKYDELTIAKMSGTSDETGVNSAGLVKFFKKIGWNVKTNPSDGSMTFDWENDYDNAIPAFIKWVKKNLKNGTPIMVDWIDWSGHWQVIIGYDTMGTKQFGDDVIILADPYDTSDQYQDGYYTFGAERFFYMWHESSSLTGEPQQQPYVIATPPDNEE